LPFELLLRLLFVTIATLDWLFLGNRSRRDSNEFATPRNIELRHLVGHSDDQLRTQDNHRD
jgi:hypothetical protein